ncbi:hypothetical protein B0H16DRAFT_1476215 [Mycena metata]|uniref:Uncharacterized protein n=1 Tax=Mycena metata TaxID=1033252 RepID=A0AAD7HDB3_9AGAR|nr:hypothetical protein B0H16DRAFT_1476215 [Mycena metata]
MADPTMAHLTLPVAFLEDGPNNHAGDVPMPPALPCSADRTADPHTIAAKIEHRASTSGYSGRASTKPPPAWPQQPSGIFKYKGQQYLDGLLCHRTHSFCTVDVHPTDNEIESFRHVTHLRVAFPDPSPAVFAVVPGDHVVVKEGARTRYDLEHDNDPGWDSERMLVARETPVAEAAPMPPVRPDHRWPPILTIGALLPAMNQGQSSAATGAIAELIEVPQSLVIHVFMCGDCVQTLRTIKPDNFPYRENGSWDSLSLLLIALLEYIILSISSPFSLPLEYRDNVFLPTMAKYEELMTKHKGPDLEKVAPKLKEGEKEIIALFHNKCCFYANDYKAKAWLQEGQIILQKKGRGRLIHVSDFITEVSGHLIIRDPAGKILKDARKVISPSSNGDPWWDTKQLLEQVDNAITIFLGARLSLYLTNFLHMHHWDQML